MGQEVAIEPDPHIPEAPRPVGRIHRGLPAAPGPPGAAVQLPGQTGDRRITNNTTGVVG